MFIISQAPDTHEKTDTFYVWRFFWISFLVQRLGRFKNVSFKSYLMACLCKGEFFLDGEFLFKGSWLMWRPTGEDLVSSSLFWRNGDPALCTSTLTFGKLWVNTSVCIFEASLLTLYWAELYEPISHLTSFLVWRMWSSFLTFCWGIGQIPCIPPGWRVDGACWASAGRAGWWWWGCMECWWWRPW